MLRIISANVNGIRSAANKGFFQWMTRQRADIVCLQETKAQIHQLTASQFHPRNFHCFFHDAQKPGYSGVAIYSKRQPQRVIEGIGWPDIDDEGRYLQLDFDDLSIVSLYLPSGTSSPERQAFKMRFLDRFMPYLEKIKTQDREFILCGDWNIAHKKIDLKNWRGNQKHSGFLPEERAWMDDLFEKAGFIDAFRQINPHAEQYTWWSNRGQAWANNVGWRIDYQIITPGLRDKILGERIYKNKRFSDHAPLIMDYDIRLAEST